MAHSRLIELFLLDPVQEHTHIYIYGKSFHFCLEPISMAFLIPPMASFHI